MPNAVLDGKNHWDDVRNRAFPICSSCKNWKVGTENCRAFPNGIPDEIFIHGNTHIKPFPEDHGIQFEAIKKEPKQ